VRIGPAAPAAREPADRKLAPHGAAEKPEAPKTGPSKPEARKVVPEKTPAVRAAPVRKPAMEGPTARVGPARKPSTEKIKPKPPIVKPDPDGVTSTKPTGAKGEHRTGTRGMPSAQPPGQAANGPREKPGRDGAD